MLRDLRQDGLQLKPLPPPTENLEEMPEIPEKPPKLTGGRELSFRALRRCLFED